MIGTTLFRFARWLSKHSMAGKVIGWGFQYGSRLIPVRRLVDTREVTAFPHPKPSYEAHVLVIPKRAIATFLDLLKIENQRYLFALLETARIFDGEVIEGLVFEHPNPGREAHQVVTLPVNWQEGMDVFAGEFQRLIEAHSQMYKGYTVFVQFDPLPEGCGLVLHLVSGKTRHA